MPAPHRITLANELGELAKAEDWLAEWCADCALAPDLAFSIRLCLEEALANVVMHGYDGPGHEVSVDFACDSAHAIVTVVDSGKPFDPLSAPPPSAPATLEEAQIGGRGVALMRQFSSELAYSREDGRNRLVMRFERARNGTSAPGR